MLCDAMIWHLVCCGDDACCCDLLLVLYVIASSVWRFVLGYCTLRVCMFELLLTRCCVMRLLCDVPCWFVVLCMRYVVPRCVYACNVVFRGCCVVAVVDCCWAFARCAVLCCVVVVSVAMC